MTNAVRKQRTRAQWAARIRAAHKETVGAILKLGRELSAAKKALKHGEFLKMIEEDLPFTASVAQRLMKIAADPKIANAARAQLLPPAWGALYELTKLPAETFQRASASGVIHPAMTRDDATRLLKVPVTHETRRITSVSYKSQDDDERPTVVQVKSEGPIPLLLDDKLRRLESVVAEIEQEMQRRHDTSAVEKRISAAADRLLSLIKQKNAATDAGRMSYRHH